MFKEVTTRTDALVDSLLGVWEQAVRATHDFLTEEDICQIKEIVPDALRHVPRLMVAEDATGQAIGFMGMDGDCLEMLFLAPAFHGRGIGRALLTTGIENYGLRRLTVNEQNPSALGFYQHMGFEVAKRTDVDEQGRPFPLLYMTLAE